MFKELEFKTVLVKTGFGRGRLTVNIQMRNNTINGIFSKLSANEFNEYCPGYTSLEILVASDSIFAFKPRVTKVKKKAVKCFGMTALFGRIKGLKKGAYKLVKYKGMLVCDLNNQ